MDVDAPDTPHLSPAYKTTLNWSRMVEALAILASDEIPDHLVITNSRMSAIQNAIRKQLHALGVEDLETIWSLSSQGIKETFLTCENLMMSLGADGYRKLFSAKKLTFDGSVVFTHMGLGIRADLELIDGREVKSLWLITPDAKVSPRRMGKNEKWFVGGLMVINPGDQQ